MRKISIHSVDVGFCRVNFKFGSDRNPSFCLQGAGEDWQFFSLSGSHGEFEPDSPIKPRRDIEMPLPEGDDVVSREARQWLINWNQAPELKQVQENQT